MVDGSAYTSDVILYPDRIDDSWWREQGHELSTRDIAEIVAAEPKRLIVGTGQSGLMKVLPETQKLCDDSGIELIVLPTSQACDRYNDEDDKDATVAALHLTC